MAVPLHLPWLPLLSISFISLLSFSLATVYTVGGPAGWTTPSRAKLNYTDWAANTPFKVGDSLEFNYVSKAHSVLEVIRSNFRYCNKTKPLASFEDSSGKTVIELSKPGNYYFIDGVGDHCMEGQKFQAKVLSSGSSIVSSPSVGAFEPALAPSLSSSSSSSSSFEPSSSPSIPPATAAAPNANKSICLLMFIISLLFLALKHT